MVQLKRVYEPAKTSDGYRILVDRLWPRGISKDRTHIDIWLKEVAPSPELRKWFGHDPEKFDEFRIRYSDELSRNPETDTLRDIVKVRRIVTFVYAAKDESVNHAVILKKFIEENHGKQSNRTQ